MLCCLPVTCQHPLGRSRRKRWRIAFLRRDLTARRIVTCADAMNARDKSFVCAAGLVLVRQKPESAKGGMFITIQDETGIANIVVCRASSKRGGASCSGRA
ncbi:Error-prone DNA polymerase [compost metagenome]